MDKAKKKTLKKALTWAALAALVAGLAVMPLLARQEQEADGPVASVLEATAEKGSVTTALKGGGTLAAGKAMNVELPSGVKIKEFLVKNGEVVTEGTPVAVVDRVSVMNAIVAVEDTLDYLQKQIVAAKDDTVSGTIKAVPGGLVKQVFAEPGDRVQDVMLAHGALAVLSLDGRMAVSIERKVDLAAGDTVVITFEDDTEVDGRVESNLNGTVIVTVEDDDYEVDETVTVTTEDGDRIGRGQLYIHNAWKATAYSGKVNIVYAKENKEVRAGSTLLTLTETDFSGTMDSLANLHREYEELLQDLFVMYDTEMLTAPCDGMVSGIDENSEALLAAIDGEEGWFVDLLSNDTNGAEKGWTVKLLSGGAGCIKSDVEGACTAATHEEDCYYYCTGKTNCTAKDGEHKNCLSQCKSTATVGACTNSVHTTSCISNCNSSTVIGGCPNGATGPHTKKCIDGCISSNGEQECTSEIHKSTCIKTCTKSDGTKECNATLHHHEDCIKRCTKLESCGAKKHYDTCLKLCKGTEECTAKCHLETCYWSGMTYTGKVFWVQQVGTDGKVVARVDDSTVYQFTTGSSGIQLIYPTKLNTETLIKETTISTSKKYKPGDVVIRWTAYKNGEETGETGEWVYTNIPTQSGGMDGMDFSGMMGGMDFSGMMGGMAGMSGMGGIGGMGGMTGAAGSSQTLFDLNGSVLMTVTQRDAITLTISIDEKDIAKVSKGQTAEVKITALKGETFEAEVTEIGTYGTNNGGSSKFTVELTMEEDARMLAGMNATATIPMFTKMDVLTVPVAALVETVDGTYVHTAKDPDSGEPANPVKVTTGVSDGEKVEILSGLNSGDKIYYSYYDVLELDHTAKTEYSF